LAVGVGVELGVDGVVGVELGDDGVSLSVEALENKYNGPLSNSNQNKKWSFALLELNEMVL
jgi:hypothetical protein